MMFQNPWAWLGLVAMAAPIAAHLLARRPARRVAFPTLRFLDAGKRTPIRRDRLTDLGLLALRVATIVVAVGALAQPVRRAAAPSIEAGSTIVRAILVDVSPSLERRTAGGGRAMDEARQRAQNVASETATSRVLETVAPADAIEGAVAWLASQTGRRELVVISDFQPEALHQTDIDRVPAPIGVRLIRVDAEGAPGGTATAPARPLAQLASASERMMADTAERAANAVRAPATTRADRPVAVVYPRYEGRAALLNAARPMDQPWMFDVARAVTTDRTLVAAMDGRVLVTATRASIDGHDALLFLIDETASTVVAAALVTAVRRATSDELSPAERIANHRPDNELRAWEREATAVGMGAATGASSSLARWFWLGVLLLLAVEFVVRRPRRVEDLQVTHARVF